MREMLKMSKVLEMAMMMEKVKLAKIRKMTGMVGTAADLRSK